MTSLPKTYKAWAIPAPGKDFELVTRDITPPKDGQILVKVLACGVCHSDSTVVGGYMPLSYPKIPGHEIIGEVAAVPASETQWKVGERVGGGWHGGHDHTCASCRAGDHVVCENEDINGILRDGGYAEYVYLRTEAVITVPPHVDPVTFAPLNCAGVTVYNGMLKTPGLKPGNLVAIQGIGGLGHLAIQYANKMGFNVVALSTSDAKKELATQLGAKYYISGSPDEQVKQLQALGGANMIVVTAPSPAAVEPLIGGLAARGTILLLGVMAEPIALPSIPMIQRGLTVRGHPSVSFLFLSGTHVLIVFVKGAPYDCEQAIKFADLKGVKTMVEVYPFEKAPEAYKRMMEGSPRFRVVLKIADPSQ